MTQLQPANENDTEHELALARVEESGVREFLAFVVAHATYALPLSCVREIMRVPSITPVPLVLLQVNVGCGDIALPNWS